MDWWWKTLLTTAAMLVLMTAARLCGRRVAGMLAGLPTITGPTLAWTAVEHGSAFAIHAAVGSVAACAVLAMFALAYVHASRRFGALGSLACGLGAALAAVWPARAASHALPTALALALGSALIAWAALPAAVVGKPLRPQGRRMEFVGATTVGGLTALLASAGSALGAFATGMLASLPLISAAIAMAEQIASGHEASTEFLRGYVRGLFGKAAFGALFALLVMPAGVGPSLLFAAAGACLLFLRPGLRRDPLHFSAR
jgi:hypothetical protein